MRFRHSSPRLTWIHNRHFISRMSQHGYNKENHFNGFKEQTGPVDWRSLTPRNRNLLTEQNVSSIQNRQDTLWPMTENENPSTTTTYVDQQHTKAAAVPHPPVMPTEPLKILTSELAENLGLENFDSGFQSPTAYGHQQGLLKQVNGFHYGSSIDHLLSSDPPTSTSTLTTNSLLGTNMTSQPTNGFCGLKQSAHDGGSLNKIHLGLNGYNQNRHVNSDLDVSNGRNGLNNLFGLEPITPKVKVSGAWLSSLLPLFKYLLFANLLRLRVGQFSY